LPVSSGGFGLRLMQLVSPVAWWSALAQYFHLIFPLLPDGVSLSTTSNIPFILSQHSCFTTLTDFDIKLPSPCPTSSSTFFTDFKDFSPNTAGLQRKILSAINQKRLKALISQFPAKSADLARMNSLSIKSASAWLSSPPISESFLLSNQE